MTRARASSTTPSRPARSSSRRRTPIADAVAVGPRRGARGWAPPVLPVALITLVLALVAYFDLQTSLPFSDEWLYRWPLQRLLSGHGFELWPGVLPVAAAQLVAALPFAAAHLDPRLWRLSVLPFLAAIAFCSHGIARRLGAAQGRASLAAMVIAAAPITLQVAVGLLSDIAYLALMLAAAWAALLWIQERRMVLVTLLLTVLAILERQHGGGIAVAVTIALVWARGGKPDRRDLLSLGALWIVSLAALLGPFALGLASSKMRATLAGGVGNHLLPNAVGTVLESPIMAGLLLLPLVPLLLLRRSGEAARSRLGTTVLAWAVAAEVAAATFTFHFGTMIFPGDVFGAGGLGPPHLAGVKPPLLPLPVFYAVEVVVMFSTAVLLAWRRGMWRTGRLGPAGVLLVALALTQLLPMLVTSATDRYHLAVAAPLVPLLVSPIAAPVSSAGTERRVLAAGLAIVLLGIAYFGVGEQDYQAWQLARDRAASLAYGRAPAAEVDAGYESVAVHYAVPYALKTGSLPPGVNPSDLTIEHPSVRLIFATANDPRPGAGYSSIAPGRIVVVAVGR